MGNQFLKIIGAVVFASLIACAIAGCNGGDTSASRQPTSNEIKAGQDRRIKEIDDNPNLSASDKEKMKATIMGNIPGKNSGPGKK